MRFEATSTRREFLGSGIRFAGKVGVAGVVLATVGVIGTAIEKIGLITPERVKTTEDASYDLNPGWIENNTNAQFIDPANKGHFPFLREALLNNPEVKDLTKGYFNYLDENLEEGNRVGLGDALSYAIVAAHERLKDTDPAKINPKTNLVLESIHTGLFVFAAGFMPWFSTSDLKEIDVNLGEQKNSLGYFTALWKNVYPQLFVKEELKEDPENLNTGQDRAVHFAQHLLLAFEYLYSKHFDLGIENSVPLVLQGYNLVMSAGDYLTRDYRLEKEALVFSEGLGRAWEISTLSDGNNWPIGRTVDDIKEGPFDTNVDADYKGNKLGALAGINLFHRGDIGESLEIITSVIRRLNDSKFSRFETKPVF